MQDVFLTHVAKTFTNMGLFVQGDGQPIQTFLNDQGVCDKIVDHFERRGGRDVLRTLLHVLPRCGEKAVFQFSPQIRLLPSFIEDGGMRLLPGLPSQLPSPTLYSDDSPPLISFPGSRGRDHFLHGVTSEGLTVVGWTSTGFDKHGWGYNQDAIGVDFLTRTFVVNDGMGSQNESHLASHWGAMTILEVMRAKRQIPLGQALLYAHREILRKNLSQSLGTTAGAFRIHPDRTLEFSGAGDVMIFVIRTPTNGKKQVIPCFWPHTIPGTFLKAKVDTDPFSLRSHPLNHRVHSSLGDERTNRNGSSVLPELNKGFFILPEASTFYQLQPGDGVLACCDGVWGLFNFDAMGTFLTGKTPGEKFWNFYQETLYRLSLSLNSTNSPKQITGGSLQGLWIKGAYVYRTEACREEDLVEVLGPDNLTALYVEV